MHRFPPRFAAEEREREGGGEGRDSQHNTGLSVKQAYTHRSIPSAKQPSRGIQKCVTCQELTSTP